MDFWEDEQDVCMICLEEISRTSPVWNCEECFVMLHLGCVQGWIAKGPTKNTPLSAENFPTVHGEWSCPKCRANYAREEIPTKYLCFCGRTDLKREIENDKFVSAHSCGEICGKTLPDCEHTCPNLCHRGVCPVCPQMVMRLCHCGEKSQMLRCGTNSFSCGGLCNALLESCAHRCKAACHEGPCPPCPLSSVRSCNCGKAEKKEIKCGQDYSCEQKCGVKLDCGVHVCEKVCHPKGQCETCTPRQACFCGKTKYVGIKCDETPPKCTFVCGKSLPCSHKCDSLCHEGECPPCSMFIREKRCRCGANFKALPCNVEFVCQTKCNQTKNCGKHKCSKKCCEIDVHMCQDICGKKLSCTNHRCEAFCHSGNCHKCPKMVSIPCACGMSVLKITCGKENLVDPPKCRKPCSYQVCHHPPNHACHYGACPKKCDKRCEKEYETCKHLCPSICHDPVYPYIPKAPVYKQGDLFRTKEDTKEMKKAQREFGPRIRLPMDKVECPPCPIVVKRFCLGKHREFEKVCSTDPKFSCDSNCNQVLKCENHRCELKCHVVENDGSSCRQCDRRCQYSYPDCSHSCVLLCHPKSTPHPICEHIVKMDCYCNFSTIEFKCFETKNEQLVHERKHCGQKCTQKKQCGHPCSKTCHDGPCDTSTCVKRIAVTCTCTRLKDKLKCVEVIEIRKARKLAYDSVSVLKCDEECERLKKEKRLAQENESKYEFVKKKKNKPTNVQKKNSDSKQEKKDTTTVERIIQYSILAVIIAVIAFFALKGFN